jgi:hypothetical protein
MRYGSMEEAAGQYLARMLKDSLIEISNTPNYTYFDRGTAISAITSLEERIIITPKITLKPQFSYIKFKAAMEFIIRIKEIHEIISSDIQIFVEDEFDEVVVTEMLIHAVRKGYIKKTAVIDSLAQIDNPRMTAEFLNETQDINDKEEFEL